MQNLAIADLPTLVISLAALLVGIRLTKRIGWLAKMNLPAAVVGGVLVAIGTALARTWFQVEIVFASTLTDIFLLVFFTTVGLSAKLSALKAGGKPLVILCFATLLLIVIQNFAGVAIALGYGSHPYYGLLIGSISFVGGPGTAAAWAKEAQTMGLEHAPEVAIAGATFAVVVGALVAGPITGWIVARHGLSSTPDPTHAPWTTVEPDSKPHKPLPLDAVFGPLLLILASVLIGQKLNGWATSAGFVLPGFLTAMMAGVLITNTADLLRKPLDCDLIERDGEFALQAFLVMYLMSLKLWSLGVVILPLLLNVIVQVIAATAVAYFLLFRWLGRDYDAALTTGGFLGFGLSSMTVGMASMDKVASRYGPSPKAFLLITLAGSFFVDLANAFITKAFLLMPMFDPPIPK